jgi:hypothetical protein
MVSSTRTPGASTSRTSSPSASAQASPATTIDALFEAAFNVPRDARSEEYMDGARAALAFRIEGIPISRPHPVGSAAGDAFFAGVAEGHAIWRRANGAESARADSGAVLHMAAHVDGIRQRAQDINAQAGDIEILLSSIFDKLDSMADLAPAAAEAVGAINCFATCALRNVALIKEANTDILLLTSEGGAA